MEDILKRLNNIETFISELRAQVSAILAVIPHLATKADIAEVKTEIAAVRTEVRTEIAMLRTDVMTEVGSVRTEIATVRTEIAGMETAIIKWIIATVLASMALAFTIAKFVH